MSVQHNCEEHKNLRELVEKIESKLDEMHAFMVETRVIYDAHQRRLDRLESEVFGNGKPGIATQIRAVLWIASGCLGFLALIACQLIASWLS
ncbi:MAG: hypothetical protein D6741_08205 [Planctomycetota bacterium]|nr:MAG: hypothetical protein D6741_08205 [Planctomycetota bacterium]